MHLHIYEFFHYQLIYFFSVPIEKYEWSIKKDFTPLCIRFMQLGTLQNFLTTDHWCSSLHDKKLNFLRDIFSVKLLLEVNQERPTFTLVILISVLEIITKLVLKGIKIAKSRRLAKSFVAFSEYMHFTES